MEVQLVRVNLNERYAGEDDIGRTPREIPAELIVQIGRKGGRDWEREAPRARGGGEKEGEDPLPPRDRGERTHGGRRQPGRDSDAREEREGRPAGPELRARARPRLRALQAPGGLRRRPLEGREGLRRRSHPRAFQRRRTRGRQRAAVYADQEGRPALRAARGMPPGRRLRFDDRLLLAPP